MISTIRAAVWGALLASTVAFAQVVPDEVKLKTATDEYKLKHEGAEWRVRGPGDKERKLKLVGGMLALIEDGKPVLRAACADDRSIRVTDKANAVVHELKPSAEGFELFGPNKALAYRVKVKADKANVYDGKDQRIGHAKAKDDGYSVRDASDAQTLKVKGLITLAQVAYFAMPLDLGEAALLWRACP